jgi:hypothetical protein
VNAGLQDVRRKITLGDYFTPTLQRSFRPHKAWDKHFIEGGEYGAGSPRTNMKTMKTMTEWRPPNDNQGSKEIKGTLGDSNHINYGVLAPIMF